MSCRSDARFLQVAKIRDESVPQWVRDLYSAILEALIFEHSEFFQISYTAPVRIIINNEYHGYVWTCRAGRNMIYII